MDPPFYQISFYYIDIDDCIINHHCQHDAICQDEVNGYKCECLPGYEGTYCETG